MLDEKLGDGACEWEPCVCFSTEKEQLVLGKNSGSSSSPERTDTAQEGSLQGEHKKNETYLSRGSKHRTAVRPAACDSSHCLSVADKKVSAVTSIPLSRLCLGAPHVSPCSRHFTLITDTLTCTLATALPGPSPDTSPAWRAVGRTVHTQLAPCQPRTPWHRHNNSALPHRRELVSDLQFLFAPLMAERELSQN